jgi:hypothetical protein
MAETLYQIDYTAPPQKINGQIDQIIAKLGKLDQMVAKTKAELKTLGNDTPGIKTLLTLLGKLDQELKSKVTDAGKAEAALKGIGKDNRSVTSLTDRLEKLRATLATVTTTAGGATTTLAGVGAGGPGPGVGRGGGGGAVAASAGMGRRVLGGAASGAVFHAGRAALSAAGQAGKEGVSLLSDSAEKLKDFRDQLREYSSLRQHKGPDDQIVREATKFGREGTVLPEDISPFLTNYEGSAATGRKAGNLGGTVGVGGYTQAQQDELESRLKVVGAQFSTRVGLDAKTGGDLTGVVSTYMRINSEADMAGQLGGMHYGLDQGRGAITPLARSELGQAGLHIKSGHVSGLPELGAFTGLASVISKMPGSSGTSYNQMSRFLNETGLGHEEQEAFIKESGMGAVKGDYNKLKALRDHLEKVKPEDVGKFLESKGYGNTTDVRSVVGMMGNVDVLKQNIDEAKRRAANGAETLAMNAANQKEEGTGDVRAEATEFSSDIELGLTASKTARGQQFARARLKDPTQPGGQRYVATGGQILGDMWRGVTGYFAGLSGQDQRVNDDAIQRLVEGGKKVNVDVAGKFPHLMENLLGKVQQPEQYNADYGAAAGMVEAAGGDPYGANNAAKKLDAAGTMIKQAARDLAGGGGGGQTGRMFSFPNSNSTSGGAGFNPGRP